MTIKKNGIIITIIILIIIAGFLLILKNGKETLENISNYDPKTSIGVNFEESEKCRREFKEPIDVVWEGKVYGYMSSGDCLAIRRTRGQDNYPHKHPSFMACSADCAGEVCYKERVRVIGKWTEMTDMYANAFFEGKCSPYVEIEKIEAITCPKIELTGDIAEEISDQSLKDLIIQDSIDIVRSSNPGMFPQYKLEEEEDLCRSNFLWDCCGEKVDLNEDGVSEYIIFPGGFYSGEERIMEMRGVGGNGDILIYGFINQKWELIGSLSGNTSIKESNINSTKGYSNLITDIHMGYHELYIYEWAWNGKEYELIDEVFLEGRNESDELFNARVQGVWDDR